jgi:hypothetical protein
MRTIRLLLSLAIVGVASACGGDTARPSGPDPVPTSDRATRRAARPDGPLTIVWEIRTSRVVHP